MRFEFIISIKQSSCRENNAWNRGIAAAPRRDLMRQAAHRPIIWHQRARDVHLTPRNATALVAMLVIARFAGPSGLLRFLPLRRGEGGGHRLALLPGQAGLVAR